MLTSSAYHLVEDVRRLVREFPDERQVTSRVSGQLGEALAAGLELDLSFIQPNTEHYSTYPLWIEDDLSFSIAAVVCNVGQFTTVHDHCMWGVVGIYSGIEHERQFRRPGDSTPSPLQVVGESSLAHGEIAVCCTSAREIHQVSCQGAEPCIGVHIYGGDIGNVKRHMYDPDTGAETTFVLGWNALTA
jgi:predicted metal-dependent enzyme (double-stranded beta helix superfamily)